MEKKIAVLGSTGSIGTSTLDVVRRSGGRFKVVALAAGRNIPLLMEQIEEFRPGLVSVADEGLAREVAAAAGPGIEVVQGKEGCKAVATHPEAQMVVSAMVGAIGLVPTMAAIEAGKDIALANKETLVAAGPVVTRLADEKGVKLIPVDSEHSAIFQCLQGVGMEHVKRIVLTASGGPFLNRDAASLGEITVEEAVSHPNWEMGAKISIDSATMMNKGLEVIEARWLFRLPYHRISVVIHPQSIIHSMVECVDGSVIAQMGVPDMRGPILYALSWPERIDLGLPGLDFTSLPGLTFQEPDLERFPCLRLAYRAGTAGGSLPCALNAANEVAVEAFMAGRLKFFRIPEVIAAVLDEMAPEPLNSLDDVLRTDALARLKAHAYIGL